MKHQTFRSLIESLARHHDAYKVFSGFTIMAACALAAQTRESEYLEEARRWEKDELNTFAHALALLIVEMNEKPFTDLKPDKGALWKNFVVNERRKRIHYEKLERPGYFWRTYDQQEIDRVEVSGAASEAAEKLEGFECKWQPESYKAPVAWGKAYPGAAVKRVDSQNFDGFF